MAAFSSTSRSGLGQRVTGAYHSICVPKRIFRLIFITSLAITAIFFLLSVSGRGPSRSSLPVVHGKQVSLDSLPDIYSDLQPFPSSPMELHPSSESTERNPWLAAVICAAHDTERRMMIRSTWMRMYADVPFDGRFVVSNPGPLWMETVMLENRTYGDLIVLDHIPEDDITANTVKTLEFYKYLVQHDLHYQFVSKVDTDLWLNARGFWDRYLEPRLSINSSSSSTSYSDAIATVERTTIGQLYYSRPHRLAYPHGSMYTNTWDMVTLLASLRTRHPDVICGEDMAVTLLMLAGNEQATLINMNATEKFDYDDTDARAVDSAWARRKTHPKAMIHALYGDDVIAVHQLKQREMYMMVASHFDEHGIKSVTEMSEGEREKPVAWFTRLHDFLDSFGVSTRFESQLDRLPDKYLEQNDEGDWICNGVWNLGLEKTGFQDELKRL